MIPYEEKEGRWITVNGKHIFVLEGESNEDAYNRVFFGKKSTPAKKEVKSGDVVDISDNVTGGKSVKDYKEMSDGHNPMSPEEWLDDMGYDKVPTAKNFKSFGEYDDAYGNDGDKESAAQIGKDYVTIYRAQSLDYDKNIPYGSWVGLTEAYAKKHAQNALKGKNYVILKARVKADDVVWAGDSFQEWRYFPKDKAKK